MQKNNELTNFLNPKSELSELLLEITEDRDKRIYACENNVALFSLYYFSHYHTFEMPEFHKDFYKDLLFNNLTGALWIAFR